MKQYPLLIRWTCILLFGILLVYVLNAARTLLYPLALAALISFLLLPVVRKLEDWKFPRALAILSCIFLLLGLFSGAIFLLYKQVYSFVQDLPALELQSFSQLERLEAWVTDKIGVEPEKQTQWLKEQVQQLFASGSGMMHSTLSATTGTLAMFAILPVYTFFLLFLRARFRVFLFKLMSSEQHHETKAVLQEITKVAYKYMVGVVSVVLILSVINSTGLFFIGLEYALLFGVISALFNFIPYFGTLLGGAVPLLFSVLSNGFSNQALAIFFFFLGVQFLENNILTPKITGSKVELNPLATILTIIIGGMIWGLPGLIVSVPFLGMFRILCKHIPSLEPYGYLLGKD